MSYASRALILSVALTILTFANAQASATETPEEVTVTAQRAKLAPRVRRFVNQIVAPENGGADGIARWQVPPMCPLVSGLTQQQGEFILERLSEVARDAQVPLAGEHCRPNLYILVTTQPEQLLREMEKRNRAFTFGHETFGTSIANTSQTPEGVVSSFIETPRAVRVWYNSNQKDPWGEGLSTCQSKSTLAFCAVPGATERKMMCQPDFYFQCGRGTAGGSHLTLSAVSTFSRVFVIVDRTKVRGATFGQLAAYVAMVGLAKLKPGADLRDAPTDLTAWDQAFLKALYATEQLAKGQSGEIARAMVREIVH